MTLSLPGWEPTVCEIHQNVLYWTSYSETQSRTGRWRIDTGEDAPPLLTRPRLGAEPTLITAKEIPA